MIRCAILHGASVLPAEGQDPAAASFLHPRETAVLGPRAVPKRRADFARGRWIAKRLITASMPGNDMAACAVLPDALGVPVALDASLRPLPLSLSISHCADYAAAAIVAVPFRVGIDVESTLTRPDVITDGYFTASEQELCGRARDDDFAARATAIWTLKEATLKVLGVGLRASSTSVVVRALRGPAGDSGWAGAEVSTDTAGAPLLRAWVRPVRGGVIALAVHPAIDGDPLAPLWFE